MNKLNYKILMIIVGIVLLLGLLGMGIGNSGNGGIEYKNIEKLSKRKLSPLRRNIIIGNNNNIGG